jgi:hypothetical protein
VRSAGIRFDRNSGSSLESIYQTSRDYPCAGVLAARSDEGWAGLIVPKYRSDGKELGQVNELDTILEPHEFSQELRAIARELWQATERVGCKMSVHTTARGMRYITGRVGSRVVCRFDLKPVAGHVCVYVRGASDHVLLASGEVHRRKNAPSWVHVRSVEQAKRLETEIRAARLRVVGGRKQ